MLLDYRSRLHLFLSTFLVSGIYLYLLFTPRFSLGPLLVVVHRVGPYRSCLVGVVVECTVP